MSIRPKGGSQTPAGLDVYGRLHKRKRKGARGRLESTHAVALDLRSRPPARGEDLADFGIPFTLKYPVSAPPPLFGGVPELLPPLPVRCQAFDYAGITLWPISYAEIRAAPERCAHWLCRNDYAKSKTCSGSNQSSRLPVGRGSRCVLISFDRLRGVDGQPSGEQAHGQEAADAVD
jgi:hypothetical protein